MTDDLPARLRFSAVTAPESRAVLYTEAAERIEALTAERDAARAVIAEALAALTEDMGQRTDLGRVQAAKAILSAAPKPAVPHSTPVSDEDAKVVLSGALHRRIPIGWGVAESVVAALHAAGYEVVRVSPHTGQKERS